MEIESKFCVPTAALFDQLLTLDRIGSHALMEPATKTITDYYLDTAGGLIRRGGFALRLRQEMGRGIWAATVKGLGPAEGAVHTRAEYQTPIEPGSPPDQWPDSEARRMALELSRGQALEPLFAIEQTRHTRTVVHGRRVVGELSLDAVTFVLGGQRRKGFELEIELGGEGTPDDLAALNAVMIELGLLPEPRSKFERGLGWLGAA